MEKKKAIKIALMCMEREAKRNAANANLYKKYGMASGKIQYELHEEILEAINVLKEMV